MATSLESFLNSRLLGQEEAIREFAEAIDNAENGPERPERTKAFLLLLGPTGTGKTEMTRLTAQYLYGANAENRLRRLDMGEYKHADSVLRLLGGAGQPALLGRAIDELNAQGGGILLLDEIEKAHPDLRTALLSFDAARSTMSDGQTKDLSRCYVVLTSNLGAADAARMTASGYSAIKRKVLFEAERSMNKEGVARFTATIVMNCLSYEVQHRIAEALLAKELSIQSQHLRRLIEVQDNSVLTYLVGKGFSPDLGARNIRKTVELYVSQALRPHGRPIQYFRVGDLFSDTLILSVDDSGRCLRARPPRRSSAFTMLLATAFEVAA